MLTVTVVFIIFGMGTALMTVPNVRQIGASLPGPAAVATRVARPVLGNLIAGLQSLTGWHVCMPPSHASPRASL